MLLKIELLIEKINNMGLIQSINKNHAIIYLFLFLLALFLDVAGKENWHRIGSTRSTRSNVSSVSSSVSTLQCSADPVEVIKYLFYAKNTLEIKSFMVVGPSEYFDNLSGAAKK